MNKALFAAAVLLGVRPAWAQAPAASGNQVVSLPIPGGGVVAAQAVQGGAGPTLVYRACAAEPCAPDSADTTTLSTTPASDVSLRVLSVGAGRRLLWAHGTGYDALIVGENRDGRPTARAAFSGATGFVTGEPGERHGPLVQVKEGEGNAQVLLGETHEDLTICGRATILAPRLLDPTDWTWKNVTVQRLPAEEREHAPELAAKRHEGAASAPFARLLRASGASSAVGTPAAATDGDLESTWAEARGGDGHGEFLELLAPEQAAIGGLSFVIRPPTREIPKGMAPRKLWVATDHELFAVTFAEDAWAHPGAAYEVTFPSAVHTSCVGVVLDEAFARGNAKEGEVTLAEVTARTELDSVSNVDGLVGALAGGGDRARMAAEILSRGGAPAFAATAKGYGALDEAGRLLALDVLDNAPCEKSTLIYAKAMASAVQGEAHHAQDRLLRCGKDAAPALRAVLAHGTPREQHLAAEQLALTSPGIAVAAILEALETAPAKNKADLRVALATAAQSERAAQVVSQKLSDRALAKEPTLDLLRALSAKGASRPEEATALGRVLADANDFRTKYLLLGPAARLGAAGDVRGDAYVRRTLRLDPEAHLRARAAEVAFALPSAVPDLIVALTDVDPRVRDAALVALTRPADLAAETDAPRVPPSGAVAGFASRLRDDPWTFVRTHAADALSSAPASAETDGALARALEYDARPEVRARAVEGLGRHRAIAFAGPVRERLEDAQEDGDVRARAARALGRMCDTESLEKLTEFARAGADPMATPAGQFIAVGSIAALGHLQPADLSKRLEPLMVSTAPRIPREAAKAAIANRGDACSRSGTK